MFRCLTISTLLHIGLIAGLLILSFFTPPHRVKKPNNFTLSMLPPLGIPGRPPGPPPGPGHQAGAAKEDVEEAPAPTPAATAKPSHTPAPAPKAAATPHPKPAKTPLVVPRHTPAPKTTAPAKPKPPTVKTPVPMKPAPAEPFKKRIVVPRKDKLVQMTPKPTPKPKLTPKPTPESAPETVVADATEFDKSGQTKEDRQTAAGTDNAPAVPAVPDAPSVPSVPAVPAVGPPPAVTGPGGNGTGKKYSSSDKVLSAGVVGIGGGGTGGGGGVPFGDPNGGSILNDLAQTYLSIVLLKIRENFTVPISRPGMQSVVQCTIDKAGAISNIKLVTSTGSDSYDHQAVQALEMTKLPALYDGLQMDSLTLNITFNYENTN